MTAPPRGWQIEGMARVLEPDVDDPNPPTDGGAGGGDPWWHRPSRLAILALAAVFLGVAGTLAATAHPGVRHGNAVDRGFLQDMRLHHEQAITMADIMVEKPATAQNGDLRQIAREILFGQQLEAGIMVQLLRDMDQPEANTTSFAMGWMGHTMAAASMPGLATDDQLQQLVAATGADADRQFARLMITHHEAGITMARYAADHAADGSVRALARSMVTGQRGEVVELTGFLTKLGG